MDSAMGAKLSAMLEYSQDIILVLDEEGRISFINPAVDRTLGYDREEMIGEDAFEFVHPEDRDAAASIFAELVDAPGHVSDRVTHRLQHANGEWKWFESIGSNRTETGLDGYVINSREITRRKEYEQQLERQRDNLDVLNQMLRHDIRNDLQLVLSYADALAEHVENDEATEHYRKLRESATHAVELTTAARNVAEVMLTAETEKRAIRLDQVLDHEIREVRDANTNAEIALDGDLPDVTVRANEMLGSVFRNLLQNAIQHTNRAVPEVTLTTTERPDTVRVRISDNGSGIPESQRDDVFVKGKKGSDSRGTGIGLYLVETLVETYGGDVWYDDSAAPGASFVVELPRAE